MSHFWRVFRGFSKKSGDPVSQVYLVTEEAFVPGASSSPPGVASGHASTACRMHGNADMRSGPDVVLPCGSDCGDLVCVSALSGKNYSSAQVHSLFKRCVEVKVSPQWSQLFVAGRVRRARPPREDGTMPFMFVAGV